MALTLAAPSTADAIDGSRLPDIQTSLDMQSIGSLGYF
jgi:hypothetical protein